MTIDNFNSSKTIFIYISKTGLSVKQLLNNDLLEKLILNNKIIILSHFIIPKSIKNQFDNKISFYFLEDKLELEITKSKTFKFFNFFRQFIYNRKNNNVTIEDFNKIFLNEKRRNFKFFLFEYSFVLVWTILRYFFGNFKILRRIFNYIDIKLHTNHQIEDLIEKYNPNILLTSSPGFLDYDFSIVNSFKKHNLKTASLLLSWDHASGLGLIRSKTDFYFVWGENSKNDLIKFNDIEKNKIFVSGPLHWNYHFNDKLLDKKNVFFKENNLNINLKTILISLKSPTRTEINEIISFLNFLKDLSIKIKCQYIIKPHPINYSNVFTNDLEKIKKFCLKNKNFILSKTFFDHHNSNKSKNLISKKNGFIEDIFYNDKNEKKYLYNLLNYSDLIINFFSTLNIEAAIHNLPSINYIFEEHKKSEKIGKNRKNLYLDYGQTHNYRLVNTGGSEVCNTKKDLIISINKFLKDKDFNKEKRYEMLLNEININDQSPTENFIKVFKKIVK